MSGDERRRNPRRAVWLRALHAAVLGREGWLPIRVTVADVSTGGLRLRTEQALEVGDRLRLTFALADDLELLVMTDAEVLHQRADQDGSYTVGCTFANAWGEGLGKIARFVTSD